MKKLVLTTLGLSLLPFVSNAAFAADENKPFTQEQIDFIKNELAKKDPSTITTSFYSLIQLNANTSDTQRTNVPDFNPEHVRLGTKIKGGIASGQVEVELIGNQNGGAAAKTDPVSGTTINNSSSNDGIVIRQAQLNLDFINMKSGDNTYLTTVSFGGVRIGGAVYIAPDIVNNPNQFSRQDGVYLQEKIGFGKNLIVNVGFGVFNTLFASSPGNGYAGWTNGTPLAQPNQWGSPSLNTTLAYVGTFNTTYNIDSTRSFNALVYAGSQKNAPSVDSSAASVTDKRDISHIEASLFYNDTKIFGSKGVLSGNGISFWYEREANARSQVLSTTSNGAYDDSEVATLYGVGAAADSSPFLSGMIQKDDRFTYAVAYDVIKNHFGNTTGQQKYTGTSTLTPFTNQNYKLYQVAASVGYSVSAFEFAFNGEYSKSDTEIFTDEKGNPQNAEMKTYLTAVYFF